MENEIYNNILNGAAQKSQKDIKEAVQIISEQAHANLSHSFKDIIGSIEKGILDFDNLQNELKTLNISTKSVGLALSSSIDETNLQMGKALKSLIPLETVFKQFQKDQKRIANLISVSLVNIPKSVGLASIINQEFTFIKSAALMTQQSIARTNLQSIGELITPFEEIRKNLNLFLLRTKLIYEADDS